MMIMMTSNPDFKATLLLDAKYPRDDTRFRHIYDEILIGSYTRPTQGS